MDEDEVEVVVGIEVGEGNEERVIIEIESVRDVVVLGVLLGLIGVKFVIGMREGDIEERVLFVVDIEMEGDEGRRIVGKVFE